MIVSLIVAVSENGGIGKDGQIPWHLSDDLKNFKRITMGHHLIMGRVTYESIGKPLPGRNLVVVTGNPDYHAEGCDVVPSLESGLKLARERGEEEAFVGGGAMLYGEALEQAQRIYFTRVHAEVQADTFFPEFDESAWVEIESTHHPSDERNEYAFTYRVLERP
ncbi:MAG: dihydrofolate reductase [Chloroflexi bacterium]|nr:dihydrofolate reductase [Chloroflexota bacterium]